MQKKIIPNTSQLVDVQSVQWHMLQICGGLCDRRANKAFHLDLTLLTSLEWTSNSVFFCLNTENT